MLRSWNSPSKPHSLRGVERADNTLAFGLLDQSMGSPVTEAARQMREDAWAILTDDAEPLTSLR